MSFASIVDSLGFPRLSGRRSQTFASSTIFDSLANGLVMVFLVVYFQRVTNESILSIGIMLTIGRLLATPTPLLAGIFSDRRGPRAAIVLGNFVSIAGVLVAATAHGAIGIVIAQALIQTGANFYWTSSRHMVQLVSNNAEMARWFALLGSLRNAGFGAGALIASAVFAIHGSNHLRWFVAASAGLFVVASTLLMLCPVGPRAGASAAEASTKSKLLRPTPAYAGFLLVNLVFVIFTMVLSTSFVLWVIDIVHLSAWWAGILTVLNTILVVVLANPMVRWLERTDRRKVVIGAMAVNGLAFAALWLSVPLPAVGAIIAMTLFMILYSAGDALSSTFMGEISMLMAREGERGQYQALFQMSWTIGMTVSPALLSALLEWGPGVFCGSLILLGVIGCLSSRYLVPRIRIETAVTSGSE